MAGGEQSNTGDNRPYGRLIKYLSPPPAPLENEQEQEEDDDDDGDGEGGGSWQCEIAESTPALHVGKEGKPRAQSLSDRPAMVRSWRRWKWNCPPPYGLSSTNTSRTAVNKHESKTDFYNLLRH